MNDFVSAMYAHDEEEEDFNEDETLAPVLNRKPELEMRQKTAVIPVGDKQVEVPNLAYVRTLEIQNSEQARDIKRLETQLTAIRITLRNLVKTVENQGRELDNKMNMRDL
jgi:hypothetical protein